MLSLMQHKAWLKGQDKLEENENGDLCPKLIVFGDVVSKEQMRQLVQIYRIPGNETEERLLDEIKRDKTMYEVPIEGDIYCMGFLTFLRSDSPK